MVSGVRCRVLLWSDVAMTLTRVIAHLHKILHSKRRWSREGIGWKWVALRLRRRNSRRMRGDMIKNSESQQECVTWINNAYTLKKNILVWKRKEKSMQETKFSRTWRSASSQFLYWQYFLRNQTASSIPCSKYWFKEGERHCSIVSLSSLIINNYENSEPT